MSGRTYIYIYTGFKQCRAGRTPYLRNLLTVGSTNMRRVSPQGEVEWWEGFNNSTNSTGKLKKNAFRLTCTKTYRQPILNLFRNTVNLPCFLPS